MREAEGEGQWWIVGRLTREFRTFSSLVVAALSSVPRNEPLLSCPGDGGPGQLAHTASISHKPDPIGSPQGCDATMGSGKVPCF